MTMGSPLTLGNGAAAAAASTSAGTENMNGEVTQASEMRSRSQSPTKRRAIEMDNGPEGVEQMKVDENATPLQNEQSTNTDDTSHRLAPSPGRPNTDRETRGRSVDMLGGTQAHE